MLDHISIGVSDLSRSIAGYDATLATLGYVRLWSDADAAGYGTSGRDDEFAIKQASPGDAVSSGRTHIAFSARGTDAVRQFHRVAMSHGFSDEGAPALHPEYGPGYFAAFVRDPDDHRLEAVYHS